MKPYRLDDRKSVKHSLTEIDLSQWKEIILTHVKSENGWKPLLDITWGAKKEKDRGFTADDVDNALLVDNMLTFIATYGPASVFREITTRSTCMKDVWEVIRKWAGIRPSGSKHLTYAKLRRAYDPSSNQSPQEYFYALRDAKEDCLLLAGSPIKFRNKTLATDEDLVPCLESDIVMDWLEALGGPSLQEHVFRVYSKDLESSSLADLQDRISENIETLLIEAEAAAEAPSTIGKAFIKGATKQPFRSNDRNTGFKGASKEPFRSNDRNTRFARNNRDSGQAKPASKSVTPCILCKAKGRPQASSHSISECFLLTTDNRKSIVGVHKVFMGDDTEEASQSDEESYEDSPSTDVEEALQD